MVNKGAEGRRRLPVEARRQQLVSVGVDLIASRSWDGLTMMDIAEAARVSKPLLYHYFSTKQELYHAAVRSAAEELRRATRPEEGVHPRDELRWSLEAHVDWIEAHHAAYRTVLQGGLSGDPEVQSIVERSRREVVERIVGSLAPQRPTPTLRIAAWGWVGFLEGACLEWLGSPDITKAELVELLAASLPATLSAARQPR